MVGSPSNPPQLLRRGSSSGSEGPQNTVDKGLFSSLGHLVVQVLEISDPHELPPKEKQTVIGRLRRGVGKAPQLYCYAKLGIVTPDDALVGAVQTSPAISCAAHCTVLPMVPARAATFPDVLSDHMLRVVVVLTAGTTEASATAYSPDPKNKSATAESVAAAGDAFGHVTIPLTHVEGGRQIVQWYPMRRAPVSAPGWEPFPSAANTSLAAAAAVAAEPAVRASVKLQISYEPVSTEDPAAQRHPHATAHRRRRRSTGRLAAQPQHQMASGDTTERKEGQTGNHIAEAMPCKMQMPHMSGDDAADATRKKIETLREVSIVSSHLCNDGKSSSSSDDDTDTGDGFSPVRDDASQGNSAEEFQASMGFDVMRILRSNRNESNSDTDSHSGSDGDGYAHASSDKNHPGPVPLPLPLMRGMSGNFDAFQNFYVSGGSGTEGEEELGGRGDVDDNKDVLGGAGQAAAGSSKKQKRLLAAAAAHAQPETPLIDDGAHRVPAGLVDYVLLLGPAPRVKQIPTVTRPATPPPVPVPVPTKSTPPPQPTTPLPPAQSSLLQSMRAGIFNGLRLSKRQADKPSPSGGSLGAEGLRSRSSSSVAGSAHGAPGNGIAGASVIQGSSHSHSSNHSGGRGRATTATAASSSLGGTSSGSCSTQLAGDPVTLWDRFPMTDHLDLPLVEQLGHFACPEGCIRKSSIHRPAPQLGSFVLSAGGQEEQHGVTLTFFVPVLQTADARDTEAEAAKKAQLAAADKPKEGMHRPSQGNLWLDAEPLSDKQNPKYRLWVGLTLCLLLRFPYVSQLQKLLLRVYRWHLLPVLAQHEQHEQQEHQMVCAKNASKADKTNSFRPTASSSTRGIVTNLKVEVPLKDNNIVSKPFPMKCEELLVFLTLECPVPIPGVYAIAMRLPEYTADFTALLEPEPEAAADKESEEVTSGKIREKKLNKVISRITAFYEKHNPEKLGKVPELLERYSGWEEQLLIDMHTKYNLSYQADSGSDSDSDNGVPGNDLSRSDTSATTQRVLVQCPAQTLLFSATTPSDMPRCPYSISAVVAALGPRNTVDLLAAALAESKILFHSKRLHVLPGVCESVRALLYPLQWVHIYVPVVPAHLLDLCEAPVPFLLGTHSDWLHHIPADCLRDAVVVDVDAGTLDYGFLGATDGGGNFPRSGKNFGSTLLKFPVDTDRWLVLALSLLLYRGAGEADSLIDTSMEESAATVTEDGKDDECFLGAESTSAEGGAVARAAARDAAIQVLIFDTMLHFLHQVPDCLFYLNERLPIFNRPLLLAETQSQSSRWFLQQLSDTNAFHTFTDSIPHSKNLVFFRKAAERFKRLQAAVDCVGGENTGTTFESSTSGTGISNDDLPPRPRSVRDVRPSSLPRWVEASYAYGVRCRIASGAGPAFPLLREALLLRLELHMPHIQWLQAAKGTPTDPTIYLDLSPSFAIQPPVKTRIEDSDTESDAEVAASLETEEQDLLPRITLSDDANGGTATLEFVRFVHVPADGSEMFDQGVGEPAARPALVKLATTAASARAAASPIQVTRRNSKDGLGMTLPSTRNAGGRHGSSPASALRPVSPATTSTNFAAGNAAGMCAPGDAFEWAGLISAAQHMRVWTLDALSEEQGLSSAQFSKSYLITLHLRSKLDQGASPAQHSAPVPSSGAGAVEWAFALGADAMRLVSVDGKHIPVSTRIVNSTAAASVDGNARAGVSAFLTNLISNENPAKQDALLEGCLLSLCSLPGRRLLLRLLREAKKERSRTAASSSANTAPFTPSTPTTISKKGDGKRKTTLHEVYRLDLVDEDGAAEHPSSKLSSSLRAFPLNYSAFEALTICFLEILQHCTRTEDYSTAYDLLEVGGLYFLFSGDAAEAAAGGAPFLSSQIYHHPIYQAARLWLAELRRRVQVLPTPAEATMAQFDAEVVLEARGVLTIMCDIDVNFERATTFIQAVASDYGLGLPVYYELARFTKQLYGRSEEDDVSTALFAEDCIYSEHSGESGTETRDTSLHASSRGGMSDLHTSTHSHHSQAEEAEDVLTAMAENIVNATHLRQRRASLVGYMQIKQELEMGDA